jgi:hypothetical protein
MILKNVAGQWVYLVAYDKGASAFKTGDSANIAGSLSKDGGSRSALTNAVAEVDATNMPGVYKQALAQAETNADAVAFAWKSATIDIEVEPLLVFPTPSPGTTGGAAGNADAAAIKAKTDQLVFSLAGKVDAAIVDAASFAQAAADKAWATAARTLTAFGFAVDISAAAVAAVWGAATRTLTAFGFAVDLSAAGVAAVWSATTRTLTAGVDITVASIAAVWDYLTSALVTPGSVGELVVSTLDVSVSSRASQASVDALDDAVAALGDPLMAIVPGGYPSGSAGAALGRIGTGVVQYVSPLSQDGTRMDVKRGDDYLSADARAFVWTDGENMWLDPLASATFTARIGGVITLTKPCDVTVPTGAGKQVRLELTAEETAALELGTPAYRFDVELVDADGHKDSAQIHGRMYVVEDQTHA